MPAINAKIGILAKKVAVIMPDNFNILFFSLLPIKINNIDTIKLIIYTAYVSKYDSSYKLLLLLPKALSLFLVYHFQISIKSTL